MTELAATRLRSFGNPPEQAARAASASVKRVNQSSLGFPERKAMTMARKDQQRPTGGNPLKEQGRSKASRREAADRANPVSQRVPTDRTATRQGGSGKGGGEPDTSHPTQRGGIRPDMDERIRPD